MKSKFLLIYLKLKLSQDNLIRKYNRLDRYRFQIKRQENHKHAPNRRATAFKRV